MSQTYVCLLFWLIYSLILGCSPRDNASRDTAPLKERSPGNAPLRNVPPAAENASAHTADQAERASHDDQALMQGKWKFVEFLIGGDLLVDTSGQIVTIDGNRLHIPGSRKRPEKDLTFTLDSRKIPKQIDFDSPASTKGIYRLTSDELTIVTSAVTRPKGIEVDDADPDAANDSTVVRLVLRRDNDASEHSVEKNP